VLDGVYVRRAGMDGECLSFLRLSAPTEGEVQNVAERTAKRVAAILKNRGRSIEGLSGGEVGDDIEPALMACYDVAARAPALPMWTTPPEEKRDASRGRGFCDMCSPSM
ncbi:MAG TPA: hypothetical protein VM686_25805, partial [Polyangiaceae bacterium]|nr:hypothetical protein [Polyangiaceae bacterium]